MNAKVEVTREEIADMLAKAAEVAASQEQRKASA